MRRFLLVTLWFGLAAVRAWEGIPPLASAAWAAEGEVHGRALANGRPAPHAVIWLEAPGAARRSPRGPVVLDQRNLTFYPHVLAVQVGTTVDFPNNDRVFHNVFSYRDGRRFDLGLYPAGAVRKVRFDQPGLSRLFCNIHPGMAAYIMAVDTPYFAVSDARGNFALRDIPPGQYTYHAWRPGGADLSGSMAIRPGTPVEVRWP
jgi:plastocyanin